MSGYNDFEYLPADHFVEMSGKGIFGKVGNLEIRIGSEEFATNKKTSDKNKKSSLVFVTINEIYKGYYGISNKYRDNFENVISQLKQNFDLYLLSGDNDYEKENLKNYFDNDKIFFNQKPQDKKDFIEKLQSEEKNILMTGDGLNDAGALMQANVALSVADDIYHFSPAGDAVLEAKKFNKLAEFINFTKTSLKIVKASFVISFIYNVIGITIALSGTLSPVIAAILMPISSISVVAFATFTTRILGRKLL